MPISLTPMTFIESGRSHLCHFLADLPRSLKTGEFYRVGDFLKTWRKRGVNRKERLGGVCSNTRWLLLMSGLHFTLA